MSLKQFSYRVKGLFCVLVISFICMSFELYLYDLRAKPSDAIDDVGVLVNVEHDLCALKTIAVPQEHNQRKIIVFLNDSNTVYYFPTDFFDNALEEGLLKNSSIFVNSRFSILSCLSGVEKKISNLDILVIAQFDSIHSMENIRVLMGSLHSNYPGSQVITVGSVGSSSLSIQQEIALFENSTFMLQSQEFQNLFDAMKMTFDPSAQIKKRTLFLQPTHDQILKAKCSLDYKWEDPPYIPPRDSKIHKKKFCMCIATYSGSFKGKLPDFSFFQTTLKSFLETTTSTSFDWEFYVGFQADPYFDGRHQEFQRVFDDMIRKANRTDVLLNMMYTPLNKGLIDITYKYNMILDRAYRDQCDYLYQYSDDTYFQTIGWAEDLVACLESQNGFGAAGIQNINLWDQVTRTVTLSMAGRKHIEIFGSYWPTQFKNWSSDKWVTNVYRDYFCLPKQHFGKNTGSYGTRYDGCPHTKLYHELSRDGVQRLYNYIQDNKSSYPMINETIFEDPTVMYYNY